MGIDTNFIFRLRSGTESDGFEARFIIRHQPLTTSRIQWLNDMDFSWFSAYRYGDLESVHPPEKRSAFVMQLLQPFNLSLVESRCLLLPDTIDLSKNAAYGLLKNEGALEVLLSDGPTATAEFHSDRMTEMGAIGRFAEYGHSHAGFAESIHRLVAEGKEAEAEKIVASIPELAELLPLLKRNRFFYFGR